MHPLVAEAMKKSAICWVTAGGGPAYPMWCLGIDDDLYVVAGGDEQRAPGLAEAVAGGGAVSVGARGDHGGRIVTWPVTAARVEPGTDAWEAVAPQLAGKRLNASGTTEALVARWVTDAAIYRLAPGEDASVDIDAEDATAERAVPRESPATRRPAKPFRLHRVRKR